ncbi:hypothetical protein J7K25_00245 [bacterium]|nr:hypothetical protein [bacterium]
MEKEIKNINVICPIYVYGEFLEERPVILNKNMRLRRLNFGKQEDKLIKEKIYLPSIKYNYILEFSYNYDSQDLNEPYPSILSVVSKVEIALRVFKKGKIGIAGIISNSEVSPFPVVLDASMPVGENRYFVNQEDLKEFNEEFPRFYSCLDFAYQKKIVAFTWFNKSYQENDGSIDKIIDYTICLENLFVPLNSREKKNYILKGMEILGFKKFEIEKIKILYECRNAIVHADLEKYMNLKKKYLITSTHFKSWEDIIRKVLQIYIKNPW